MPGIKRQLSLTPSDSSSDEETFADMARRKKAKLTHTSTKKKVATLNDFFKSNGKFDYAVETPGDFIWITHVPNAPGSTKIAAFDMDWTLVQPKTGKKFPKGRGDWVWWPVGSPHVKKKLKQLHKDGYKIVVFTNQAGIEKKKATSEEIIGKIQDISNSIEVPFVGIISGSKNEWRKPHTTSWEHFSKHHNQGVEINLKDSFFVGDAAGREKNWTKGAKKDFNCSDRMFAENMGLKFHTPDSFFLNKPETDKWLYHITNPHTYASKFGTKADLPSPSTTQEMIIMVGCQGSGKSTISTKILSDYVRVNRDTLKSEPKCKKLTEQSLKDGKSVVIDNTNPSPKKRALYLSFAKKYGVRARCFWMTNGGLTRDVEFGKHLNGFRTRMTGKRPVPGVAFNCYRSRFSEPKKSEGFAEIIKVPFVPLFPDENHKRLFTHWVPKLR